MTMTAETTLEAERGRGGRLRVVVPALAAAAVLAGAPAGAAGAAGADQAITITAQPGKTVVAGADSLQGGFTAVTMVAGPAREGSNLVLARLNDGVTLAQLRRATRRNEDVPEDLITLPTSGFLQPGGRFRTTVRLAPGNYVAAQVPDGPGIGPAAEFTVAPGSVGRAPAATARISMFDYGFRGPASIRGKGTLLVKNIGKNFHFVFGVRLAPGVDARQVIASIRAGDLEGPPPGEEVALLGLVSPGTANYIETDLQPGIYVIACFFADRHSAGVDHGHFGMVRRLIVR
jgi:hypothetical protein